MLVPFGFICCVEETDFIFSVVVVVTGGMSNRLALFLGSGVQIFIFAVVNL